MYLYFLVLVVQVVMVINQLSLFHIYTMTYISTLPLSTTIAVCIES